MASATEKSVAGADKVQEISKKMSHSLSEKDLSSKHLMASLTDDKECNDDVDKALNSLSEGLIQKCVVDLDREGSRADESGKHVVSPAENPALAPEKAKKTVRLQSSDNCANEDAMKVPFLKPSPSVGTNLQNFELIMSPGNKTNGSTVNSETGSMMDEAWEKLKKSFVYFKGKPVGTLAALDPSAEALNYNQVYI